MRTRTTHRYPQPPQSSASSSPAEDSQELEEARSPGAELSSSSEYYRMRRTGMLGTPGWRVGVRSPGSGASRERKVGIPSTVLRWPWAPAGPSGSSQSTWALEESLPGSSTAGAPQRLW